MSQIETCNKSIKLVQAQKKHLSSSFGFVLNLVYSWNYFLSSRLYILKIFDPPLPFKVSKSIGMYSIAYENKLCLYNYLYCLNVSTTPITAMGCRQCLPLSVVQLKGKHCRKPHCRNGVVDTFEHSYLPSLSALEGPIVRDLYRLHKS